MADHMSYVLGIDFGGGASKATLLRADGTVSATNTVEYLTSYPRSGFTEQNPDDWYSAVQKNITAVLGKSGISAGDIAAVCLDAATHTAVLMDEQFVPLAPAIYWTDTRSAEQAAYLREQYGDLIRTRTLHTPDTIWTLPQLLWVQKHQPDIWAKTKKILFAKDYVRHRLTGDYVTDFIEAQGSMLYDVVSMAWSPELCAIAGIQPESLPHIVSPGDIVGAVTKAAAADTGLAEGTPVLCGTTDTVLEVFASGAIEPGNMTVKMATAGRICVVTDHPYQNQHLVTYSHLQPGLWYPGSATKSCAASYRWYRDTFGGDYDELDAQAANIAPGCNGLIFHPYLNGELTPYADPQLRGSFTGIRAGHTMAHFSRAVLEGAAMSLLDCKQTLSAIGLPVGTCATVIGGGSKSLLWRQILSDVLGMTLVQRDHSDSSFGAAMLAGVAVGMFDSLADALQTCVKTVSEMMPNLENTKKYVEQFQYYKEIQAALSPIYHTL